MTEEEALRTDYYLGTIIEPTKTVGFSLPFEIVPGEFVLRRPEGDEVEAVRRRFETAYHYAAFGGGHYSPYESITIPKSETGSTIIPLKDETKFNYLVIEPISEEAFRRLAGFTDLQYAFLLSEVELSVDATLRPSIATKVRSGEPVRVFGTAGQPWSPLRVIARWYDLGEDRVYSKGRKDCGTSTLNLEAVKDIQNLFNQLSGFDFSRHEWLKRALREFTELGAISFVSPIKFVAMFSIIESLICADQDRQTTITRQIKRKLPLLNKRFSTPFDLKEEFSRSKKLPDTTTEELIFEKLYHHRSSIAHGTEFDFEGNGQILHDRRTATRVLHQFLRKLLRFCLEDPDLVRDLKMC